MPTLAEMFPMLPFAKDADRWLKVLENNINDPGVDIFQQLKSRKVGEIMFLPTIITAGMKPIGGGFHFVFNFHCLKEWAFEALGHEIAHTFHYDLSKDPPEKTIEFYSKELEYFDERGEHKGYHVEDFCDEFSRRWRALNTRERMERWCAGDDDLLANVLLMFSRWRE